jgi:hypothetical protein
MRVLDNLRTLFMQPAQNLGWPSGDATTDSQEVEAVHHADEIVDEFAACDPAYLAAVLETDSDDRENPSQTTSAVAAELRRRSAAGVRKWQFLLAPMGATAKVAMPCRVQPGSIGTDIASIPLKPEDPLSAVSQNNSIMVQCASLEDTMARSKPARPYWRYARTAERKYEPDYLMKLGNLTREDALALILEHQGDRHCINAELISRKRQTTQTLDIDLQ